MKLTFWGAAHEVTGSCHMISVGDRHILVDCGMEQGPDIYKNQELSVEPADIDCVLLTHAHIDHMMGLDSLKERTGALVAAGYADAHRVGAVDPMEIPKVAKDAGCDLAMLDTAVKDGHTLFDYLDLDKLKEFVDEAHSYGLLTALAGSVKKDQLKPLHDIGCDVVGIRGAACVGGDRNTGKIHHTAVAELKELIDSF